MSDDPQFAQGVFFYPPPDNAPSFVLGKISFKREEVIEWLTSLEGEWVNVDALRSKGGKAYCKLNTYKKGATPAPARPATPSKTVKPGYMTPAIAKPGVEASGDQIEYPTEDINPDDIPF